MSDIGHWWYEKGKSFACYNNSTGWYGHVRDHKPHIFWNRGKWNVVYAGVHHNDYLKEFIERRNSVAHYWCNMMNKTEEERKCWSYKPHMARLADQQKECRIKDLAERARQRVFQKRREREQANN